MNENKYRTLTEKLSVPEELNDRVVQAVRRQERLEREETGRRAAGERRRWLLRGAVCAACALELVHNYSLIHDDLPCMDDDDLRRGQPTTHKKFGETLAVLAGDALQPEAFRLIAEAPCMSDGSRVEAVRVLARACGADGMVAGQVLDTLYGIHTEEQLKAMYRLKTGVMISGAAELGCVAADMPADMRAQAVEFADQLGLAFQIRDDMLDVVGDEQVFGKPIGSDKEEGKITYVDVDGLEGCARAVEACTQKAKDAVAQWPDHEFLFALADQLVDRNK